MRKLAFNVQLLPAVEFQLDEAYIPVSLSVLNQMFSQLKMEGFTFAARVYLTADWSILNLLHLFSG